MTTPPTPDGPQLRTLIAVVVGLLAVIVLVLGMVFDMGLLQIGFVLLPILAVTGLGVFSLLWAKRRGEL